MTRAAYRVLRAGIAEQVYRRNRRYGSGNHGLALVRCVRGKR